MNCQSSLTAIGELVHRFPRCIGPATKPIVLAVRYFPSFEADLINRFWSSSGSLYEGRFALTDPDTGYQANLLRSGVCCACWLWRHVSQIPFRSG